MTVQATVASAHAVTEPGIIDGPIRGYTTGTAIAESHLR